MKIMFVCTGNTCRSAMAEWMFRRMLEAAGISGVEVVSSGTHASPQYKVPPVVLELMSGRGIDMNAHRSRPLSAQSVSEADLILTMENYHRALVLSEFPEVSGKVFLFKEYARASGRTEIADPMGFEDTVYINCADEIEQSLQGLLERIKSGNSGEKK